MGRLEGKVAVVTGATGGIGEATVECFVREGARVAVAARSVERATALAGRFGEAAFPVRFELSDPDSIRAAMDETARRFGRLDVLFNNAAATDDRLQARDTTVTDIPLEVWDEVLEANLRSTLLACRFAIPHMLAGGGGSIVNNSSGSGLAGDEARVAYGTSKAAVLAFTQYVAVQYGRQGIRCNAIAPGLVLIPRLAGNERLKQGALRQVLTPRLGTPADVALLAVFLGSDESGYITGQTIRCDGGYLAHQPR